jgi:hypothetical protein
VSRAISFSLLVWLAFFFFFALFSVMTVPSRLLQRASRTLITTTNVWLSRFHKLVLQFFVRKLACSSREQIVMENAEEEKLIDERYSAMSHMRRICRPCFVLDFNEAKRLKALAVGAVLVRGRDRSGTITFVCESCSKTERGAGKKLCQACAESANKCEICACGVWNTKKQQGGETERSDYTKTKYKSNKTVLFKWSKIVQTCGFTLSIHKQMWNLRLWVWLSPNIKPQESFSDEAKERKKLFGQKCCQFFLQRAALANLCK